MIPSVGIESAPADILTWSVVKTVREKLSCQPREVVSAIEEMKYVPNPKVRGTLLLTGF